MNQKGFVNISILILAVIILGGVGYFIFDRSTEPTSETTLIDATFFTVSLPTNWKFNKLQGIDSYVGEFVGDNAKLSFDYGQYSNPLAKDGDPDHIITYETISGRRAKIVVPKITGKGTTGVYFNDLGYQIAGFGFQISGQNLTSPQQETALKIFRSLQFKKP